MKFSLDAGFLYLGSFNKSSELLQSVAWLVLSLGMILIFLFMVAGLLKISQVKRKTQGEIF